MPLENGGQLRVELNHRSFNQMQELFIDKTNDNRILSVSLNLMLEEKQKENPRPVILVSKDALMRVKSDALGLPAEDFLSDRVVSEYSSIYEGYRILKVPVDLIQLFYTRTPCPIKELLPKQSFYPHQFIILRDELGGSSSAIGRIGEDGNIFIPFSMEMKLYGA